MNIDQIIPERLDVVKTFFEHAQNMIVVLTDTDYVIQDCNKAFTSSLHLMDKPQGRFLGDFLSSVDDGEFSLSVSRSAERVFHHVLRMRAEGDDLYRCMSFALGEHILLFGESLGSSENAILTSMSLLNNELSTVSRELTRKNHELEAANQRISELMRTDPLTKLANRRSFQERFQAAFSLARRQEQPLSVIMLDIDHFKQVNDTFGHSAGDTVLKALGVLLKDSCREEDVAARFGGEEFILCLPNTDCNEAKACAERIRARMAGQDILGQGYPITVSLGIAELLPQDSMDGLITRADRALYAAKRHGRNRCMQDEP
mgnify:CR=1 FL=1